MLPARDAGAGRVKAAIVRGDLPHVAGLPCEACAAPAHEWHHHDYALAIDVVALCYSCHRRVHGGSLPEPRTGRVYGAGQRARHHDLIVSVRGPSRFDREIGRALIREMLRVGDLAPSDVAKHLGGAVPFVTSAVRS